MVDQDALDCSRGLGCAWEEADDAPRRPHASEDKPGRQALRLFAPQPSLAWAGAGAAGGVMASSDAGTGGGSSTGGGGQFAGPPRPGRPGAPPGQERTVSYQPEERYWTDYLRIALPLVGLIVLLGVFWYWGNRLIGGGSDDEPTPTAALAEVSEINASPPVATEAPTAPSVAPTPGAPPTPNPADEQPAAGETEPANTAEDAPTEPPTEPEPPAEESGAPVTTFPPREVGSTAITDGRVRVRSAPSSESGDILVELEDGTEVTITADQVDDEDGSDNEWYPIETADGESGYIREDLFVPAE